MIITYHGISCIKLTTKSGDGKDVVLVTDPFDAKKAGIKLPRLKAHVALLSNNDSEFHNNTSAVNPVGDEELVVINEPGEYETHGIALHGVQDDERESIVYRIELERITIAFLGSITKPSALSDVQNDVLQNADILILPIGGKAVTDMKQAREIVNQLQPRMVLPVYYDLPGLKLKDLTGTPEQFITKELGIKADDATSKFKITASGLPNDEMRGILLTT